MTGEAGRGLSAALWLGAVLAACALSAMGIAALAPRIVTDLGLPPEAVGLFSSVVWATALFASQASGVLVRRWGPWPVSRLSVLACALGLAAVATGWSAAFWAGALCIGIGQGLEAPAASQLLAHHGRGPRKPLLFSLKQMGVQAGAVLASLSLPLLAVLAGWRSALAAMLAALVLLVMCLARPARALAMPAHAELAATPGGLPRALVRGLVDWLPLLRANPGLARLALAAAAFSATQVCLNTFLVTWGVVVRGLSLPEAGALAATAQAAGLVGRPLWGWVASRGGGAASVLTGLGLAMAMCSTVFGLAGDWLPMAALVPLAAGFGLSASGWNGVFLSEVAARSAHGEIAHATAAALVPVFLGLILGPLAFATVGHALGLSAGFFAGGALALAGSLCAPRGHAGHER